MCCAGSCGERCAMPICWAAGIRWFGGWCRLWCSRWARAYPELLRAQPLITETLRLEETNFKQTLERGLRLLEEETARLGPGEDLPGEIAFRLYDTYGFPLDLTEDVLRGQGRKVAVEGFERAMARQREEARKSWVGSGEAATEAVWFALREELGATEFLGYETESAEGVVLAIMRDGARVAEAAARRRRCGNRQPDAVLCGVGRPGW